MTQVFQRQIFVGGWVRQHATVAEWPLAPQRQRVGRPPSAVRQDRPGPASVNLQ
jgi:hypothetical protein